MDTAETRRLIMGIVDALPEDQRLCVLMHYYSDLDLHEISAALEVPYETVKSRLRYARRKISDGVEALERNGTKLFGAAPIPLLAWVLKGAVTGGSQALPYAILGGSAAAGAAVTGGGIVAALTIPKIIAGVAAAAVIAGGATVAARLLPRRAESASEPATAIALLDETEQHLNLAALADELLAHHAGSIPASTAQYTYTQPPTTTTAFSTSTTAFAGTAAPVARTAPMPATAAPTTTAAAITTTIPPTTTIPSYTVTYNYAYNGGASAERSSASVLRGGAADLSPAAQKPGWAFLGWNTDRNAHAGLTGLAVNVNTTLYAIFSRQVTVYFHDNAYADPVPDNYASFSYRGSGNTLTRYNNGAAALAAPAPRAIAGWNAMGWTARGALGAQVEIIPGAAVHITEDTHFYAIYRRDVLVKFDTAIGDPVPERVHTLYYISLPSGGSNIYPNIILPSLPPVAISPLHGFIWVHDGWTDDDGVSYAPGASVKPTVTSFKALWRDGLE
jgi:hypothetical protein